MSRRALAVTVVLLATGVLVDLLVGAERPGWYAALGLGGCIVIIVVSKWLGKIWLQRPPDYYARRRAGARAPDA